MAPAFQPTLDITGVVVVDKPTGMTSHDVVSRMRRVAGTRQVGHTGTLDPLAEGILLVCINQATRIAQFLTGLDKVYTGIIRLGAISTTYDAQGDITTQQRPVPDGPEAVDLLRDAMRELTGERIQLPPPYSAVKVAGKKLYEYARSGEEVPQKPRPVSIRRFALLKYDAPEIHFEAHVGSGTYIRSMAHDLGIALGCGAYLASLRRTRIGSFHEASAVPLETLMAEPALLGAHLLSITEALAHLPRIVVGSDVRRAIMHGRSFTTREVDESEGTLAPGRPILVVDARGEALSVVSGAVEEEAGGAIETESDAADDMVPHSFASAASEFTIGVTPLVFRPLRVLVQA